MFGDDRFERDERVALSLLVDGRHAELVLLALIQPGDVTLRRPTELADRRPLAGLLVLLLHDVMADRLTAVVLQRYDTSKYKFGLVERGLKIVQGEGR